MEDILALFIPIVAVSGFFLWMISLSPVGKAYAERLRGGKAAAQDGISPEEHTELIETVEQLRREVAELAERVDFTERLLGQGQAAGQLGKPRA